MRGNGMGASQERMSVIAYQVFSRELQNLWEQMNLRVAVLISLFCQIILIFLASTRKRSGNLLIQAVIWSSYLLADWIAAFSVGLISSGQSEKCEKAAVNDALAAFWAPFLLLHLGGPDTITAFSLEDNELWIRHMLSVVVQVTGVGYVFIQSLPNQFWLPIALMFSAGTIKYAERTRALYLACSRSLNDSLRPKRDFGSNYVQLMEEYSSKKEAAVPVEIYRVPKFEKEVWMSSQRKIEMGEKEVIQRAYWLYNIFRGLIVDHIFSFSERNESRKFFFSLSAKNAFKVMEVELNFMYDTLYTKMGTVHHGILGYIMRFVCGALLGAAFVLFSYHHKSNINRFDMAVTYALLGGAVTLDFVALIKLIFSDWTVALIDSRASSIPAIWPLLKYLKVTSGALAIHRNISFRKRWSEQLDQYNLISYCRQNYIFVDKAAELFALREFLDRLRHKTQETLDDGFKEFIFEGLEEKAKIAQETEVAKDIISSRGERAILDYAGHCHPLVEQSLSEVFEYDQRVLMWHIATEICFHHYKDTIDENRTRCKQLSDYLLYLLIMQPKLMLAVAGIANIRFQDTCEEARKLFQHSGSKLNQHDACAKLIEVDTTINPVEVIDRNNNSLLFDAVRLAKELKRMVDSHSKETWKMMSKVWFELLCYGASHCRGDAHAQQLRQGGELVTFVWLLMAHFGLGVQFKTEAEHAKLIVNK